MADSIAGTVTAMICVVVGLLIIGCALVPVVEHASSGTTETVTGLNSVTDLSSGVECNVENDETITYSLDSGVTVNGESITMISGESVAVMGNDEIKILIGTAKITVKLVTPNILLSSGTVTITSSSIAVSGINQADNSEYSAAITASNVRLSGPYVAFPFAEPKNITTLLSSPAKIGQGQTLTYYDASDESEGTVTTDTASDSTLTLTHNTDGTLTATWDDSNEDLEVYGPMEWTQTVTSEGSQYAALYGIIPIMCILGMAYVLIRRF